ncbi:MAG: hypothetical protein ACPGQS_06330, partial [Bradymonadia bacterium]
MRIIILIACAYLASFASIAGAETEPEWDGRFSTRVVGSIDDGALNRKVLITFIDVDLLGESLTENGLEFELDTTLIWDDTESDERRFGNTESFQRTREANITHPFWGKKLKASLGRILIPASGNAWVDGVNLLTKVHKRVDVGVYGGLRPVPLTFEVSTDYQTTGTYAKYRQGSRLEFDGGYNLILRDGLDR